MSLLPMTVDISENLISFPHPLIWIYSCTNVLRFWIVICDECRLWQTFLVALVVYSAWASPFELAFRELLVGSLVPVDLVVDAFFAVDIILTFFVAYLDTSTYLLVDDHKKIALRCVCHAVMEKRKNYFRVLTWIYKVSCMYPFVYLV